MKIEDSRPVLIPDSKQVAESFGDQQQSPVALALQKRVRRDRRAHLDGFDRVLRYFVAVDQT